MLFFFHDPATTEIYTLSLHDALPIWPWANARVYLVPLEPRSRANATLTSAALAPAADSGQAPALEVGAVSYDAVAGSGAQDFALEARELAGAGTPATRDLSLGRGFVSLGAAG